MPARTKQQLGKRGQDGRATDTTRAWSRIPKEIGSSSHHLHLVPFRSQLWTERLLFRDHLRSHPQAAGEYAALKARLAETHRFDREGYTDAKGPFIRRILAIASAAAVNEPPRGSTQ